MQFRNFPLELESRKRFSSDFLFCCKLQLDVTITHKLLSRRRYKVVARTKKKGNQIEEIDFLDR